MEFAGARPPSGPIFQPGLGELTSLWRDGTADGEPLISSGRIAGPAPRPAGSGRGCPADGFWGWNLPKRKGNCSRVPNPLIKPRNIDLLGLSLPYPGMVSQVPRTSSS